MSSFSFSFFLGVASFNDNENDGTVFVYLASIHLASPPSIYFRGRLPSSFDESFDESFNNFMKTMGQLPYIFPPFI